MPNHLTYEKIRNLTLIESHDLKISIYVPLNRHGFEPEKAKIKMKKALDDLDKSLIKYNNMGITQNLETARDLLNNDSYWHSSAKGIGVLVSENVMETFLLEDDVEEFSYHGNLFYTLPLLKRMKNDVFYYVMFLSINTSKLFKATQNSINEIDIQLPNGIEEILDYDSMSGDHQYRQSAPGSHSANQPTFSNGVGGNKYNKDIFIQKYLKNVADIVLKFVTNSPAPLVLAGAEEVLSKIKPELQNIEVVSDSIHGSPERFNLSEIHERTKEMVQPHLNKEKHQFIDRYKSNIGSKFVNENIVDVLTLSFQSRVECLFVRYGVHSWGHINLVNQEIELHNQQKINSTELFNQAAYYTLLNAGMVYVLDDSEFPGSGDVCALLRF